jgi:hypothetical protein
MGYVQPVFNFRAKTVEFRLYQFRVGCMVEGINSQQFPQGKK